MTTTTTTTDGMMAAVPNETVERMYRMIKEIKPYPYDSYVMILRLHTVNGASEILFAKLLHE